MKAKIIIILSITFSVFWLTSCSEKKPATIGVYYFDGWSGKHQLADNPGEPWAKNAPTHQTRRMIEEFPDREPVWGWRNDSPEIMKWQIDLAAENGVDFFLFCWYWKNDRGAINVDALKNDYHHTSMELYLKAPNKNKLKYCLLVANHGGAEIIGKENWMDAVRYWSEYFRDPQYVTVDGKPLVILFGAGDEISDEDLEAMQRTAKEEGFKDGISIAGCGAPARQKSGFTHSTHYNVVPGYIDKSEEHKYQEIVDATKAEWIGREDQPHIPVLTAGWDKRPWEGPNGQGTGEGWYYPDSSPDQFKNFLTDAIQWMDNNPAKTTKERLVLIYAWNEMGEGGYLVPTKGDPEAAKLKMIKAVAEGK